MKTHPMVSHSTVRAILPALLFGMTLVLASCTSSSGPTPPSTVASSPPTTATTMIDPTTAPTAASANSPLDITDDYRALGYSNQRKVVRDSHNNLYIAYRKKYQGSSGTAYHIFVSKSTDNGKSWTVLNNAPIEQVGNYNQRVPAIALDAHDTLHVTWYGNDAKHTGENDRQIKYVRSNDGGATWSPWMNVAEVPGYDGQDLWQEHPAITILGNTIFITWQGLDQTSPKSSQIKLVRSSDGGTTWSAWQNISPTSGGHSRPSLVGSSNGKQLHILAYGAVNRVQQIIWSSSQDAGATWSPWSPVAPDSDDQRNVSVASDERGQLYAAWRQGASDGKTRVVYASYNGSTWSAPEAIADSDTSNQFYPSIAVSKNGDLWAVWTETSDSAGYPEDDPSSGTVVAAHKDATGTWSSPTPLAGQDTNGIYVSLDGASQEPSGSIDAVWVAREGSDRWQLHYAALSSKR